MSGEAGEAAVVVAALRSLGFSDAYGVPVAPWVCEEPIVVSPGGFERESRQADGAVRGTRQLVVHVCRGDSSVAEAVTREVAAGLAGVDWAATSGKPLRVVAGDIGQPVFHGRGLSGRWVWDVPLTLTVVVEHE